MGAVRPASRPRTPAWLPRASTPPRTTGALPERVASLRLTEPPSDDRLLSPNEPPRLGLLPRLGLELTELLRLGALLRLTLLEERLGLLLTDERLEELLDELRLMPLLLLEERLELMELRLEELLDELRLTELLWLPPPLRVPPPPRCAKAGVALSARAIITRVIAFEVFMLLLLSFLVSFSAAKVLPFPEGNSETFTYFSRLTYVAAGSDYVRRS